MILSTIFRMIIEYDMTSRAMQLIRSYSINRIGISCFFVPFAFHELNHFRIAVLRVLLSKCCQIFELLVVCWIDWSFRPLLKLGKVKSFILLPANVVYSAESLRSPRSLGEIAWVSAATVAAPILNEWKFTLS